MAATTLPEQILVGSRPRTAADAATAGVEIGAVYEANFTYVYRCLRSLGVRQDSLDDALQDVFMVVQAKLAQFDGRSQLRTWLYAIVLRVARRYRARAAREQQQAADDAELTHDRAPERELAQQERWQLAQQALATLDDDKREVFVLSQVEQMSAPEVAAVVGIPVNTVYSRLRAARLAFDAFAARAQRSQRGGSR